MVNKIIDGIVFRIKEYYPLTEYTIYTEDVKQGLKSPCFIIQSIHSTNEQVVGDRYEREENIVINYYPKDELAYRSEFNDIKSKLFELMEYISINDESANNFLLRGREMKVEISDKVLLFFVNYKYFVQRKVVNVNMESLAHEVKNGE